MFSYLCVFLMLLSISPGKKVDSSSRLPRSRPIYSSSSIHPLGSRFPIDIMGVTCVCLRRGAYMEWHFFVVVSPKCQRTRRATSLCVVKLSSSTFVCVCFSIPFLCCCFVRDKNKTHTHKKQLIGVYGSRCSTTRNSCLWIFFHVKASCSGDVCYEPSGLKRVGGLEKPDGRAGWKLRNSCALRLMRNVWNRERKERPDNTDP